ncbi:MAG: isochorismatase family protein [Actinobacteria bacterium]|nr:isochorismatase family protein [Actinomycetota bacterium]
MAAFPWDGVIPTEDLEAFAGGREMIVRDLDVGDSPALLVVDMTRAFVDSAYPLGWSDTGWPAVDATAALLAAARSAAVPVFFAKGYHDPAHKPRPAERGRWKPSQRRIGEECADLPPGDVIVDVLTPRPDEIVVLKGSRPSAFFGTQLPSYLIHAGVDTLIVCGMTTSGCVRATVLDAFQYNYNVVIPHECCADRSQISHAVSLFDLHMKYADVASTNEVCAFLSGHAERRHRRPARVPLNDT